MKTIRKTILEMYDRATDTAHQRLEKKGYLTFIGLEQCLQEEFRKLGGYYYRKKFGVEPFSEEFSDVVFKEFDAYATKELGLRTLIPPQKVAEKMEGGLIGKSKESLDKAYLRLLKRIARE